MHDIICPIIHMNGTSKDELMEQLENVHIACRELVEKMKQAAPNGRDYYPKPGLMEQAREQHYRRMKTITDLMKEIETQAIMMDRVV